MTSSPPRPLGVVALGLLSLPACAQEVPSLRLATTTSTENSGLLAALLPHFEARCSCRVQVVVAGSGQALALGASGDVDLVMVHAPELERAFVAAGHGVARRGFMQNDFVVVGPTADPAAAGQASSVAEALVRIRGSGSTFISRGDSSGTHHKEQALWELSGHRPDWSGYLAVGQGMGAVLTMAGDKQAYALTDRGTFVAHQQDLGLSVLVEGHPSMANPYAVIAVNPARHDWVQADLASQLVGWLCSEEGQGFIGDYRVGETRLFTPTCRPEGG